MGVPTSPVHAHAQPSLVGDHPGATEAKALPRAAEAWNKVRTLLETTASEAVDSVATRVSQGVVRSTAAAGRVAHEVTLPFVACSTAADSGVEILVDNVSMTCDKMTKTHEAATRTLEDTRAVAADALDLTQEVAQNVGAASLAGAAATVDAVRGTAQDLASATAQAPGAAAAAREAAVAAIVEMPATARSQAALAREGAATFAQAQAEDAQTFAQAQAAAAQSFAAEQAEGAAQAVQARVDGARSSAETLHAATVRWVDTTVAGWLDALLPAPPAPPAEPPLPMPSFENPIGYTAAD